MCPKDTSSTIPPGYCQCGCGQKTKIAQYPGPRDRACGAVHGDPRRYLRGHHKTARRTNTLDNYIVDSNGCHLYQGGLNHDGYGMITTHPYSTLAYRAAWFDRYGPVPDGLELDHLCTVRRCINTDHLEPVTHAVNVRRGRVSRLSEDQVRSIIQQRRDGATLSSLASQYGVSETTISAVSKQSKWRIH